jgi:isopentenyl diphosphate isomerase/L-lactate dehydrogenase-like FMN-dependent dehydrogenase
MAARGEEGIVSLLQVFREEMRIGMALMGINRVGELSADLLESVA